VGLIDDQGWHQAADDTHLFAEVAEPGCHFEASAADKLAAAGGIILILTHKFSAQG
jgi:hypothetical protein